MTDHLARLCFDGAGSSGHYTPHAFSLRLQGIDQPADHVVHLHEVHHAALNDVTAWGTALHVYARLPGSDGQQFGSLLDACRTTHESLATFASVQIASAWHGSLDHVLAVYPSYKPLYEAAVRLFAGVPGPNRQQQAASAMARLCMQTPVLEEIVTAGLDAFRRAAIRELDTPDGRWNWFLRHGPELPAAAAAAADRATAAAFGRAALDSDGPDGDLQESTDPSHDEAWGYWEASAYEHLRTALGATRARTIAFEGHREGTAAVYELAEARHGDIGLRDTMTDQQRHSDAAIASSVLQQVRHDLSGGERYRAVLLSPAGTGRMVDMLAGRPVLGERPALIVDARPGNRLAALYRWPGGRLPGRLRALDGPVVAIRAVVDDDGPDSAIGHCLVTAPDDLSTLLGRWPSHGIVTGCVGASCLVDSGWVARWVPALNSVGPLFVLVDIEPDAFVPPWVREGREVIAIGMHLDEADGQRTALVFTVDRVVWWLVVGDDVTVALMMEYLRGQLGPRLRNDDDAVKAFDAVRAAATVLVGHLLATESFVSFDALRIAHAD